VQLEFILPTALVAALVTWLTTRAHAEKKNQRQPPLGEDVARTYATKEELAKCREQCRGDYSALRDDIQRMDDRNEERMVRVHKRIDDLSVMVGKTNSTVGKLAGMIQTKFKIGVSTDPV